jgi:hypothetical protein
LIPNRDSPSTFGLLGYLVLPVLPNIIGSLLLGPELQTAGRSGKRPAILEILGDTYTATCFVLLLVLATALASF